ncbi:MAG TPA: LuxR C-terminal-related transcriptional regulator, partial [Mycobacteriales bacterium]|nr:LuxR C-terminal-related transcriptional regulator [Mycobacteriales bacterium]
LEGADLDSDQIRALHSASEGWPAAVRFALQEVARTGDARTWPEALDTYVRTGIIPAIEPDELSFLRNTCALDRLQAATLPLMPAPPEMLDRCRSGGWLIRSGIDGHRQHRLIRDPLRREETARRPEQVAAWHRRLADRLRADDPVQALRYACRTDDSDLISGICRQHWFAVTRSPEVVLDAFDRLPESLWRNDPELLLAFAAAHRALPGHEHCASTLVRAAQEAAERNDDSSVRTVAAIATGRQLAHLNSGDHGQAVSARAAVAARLQEISPDEAITDAEAIAFFHASCGLVEVVLGEFRTAGEAFQAGRTAATVSRNAHARLMCAGGQLLLDALTGHLDRVEEQLPEMRRLADELQVATGPAISAAEIGAGLAAMERQQGAPADEHFVRARRSAAPLGQLWPLLAYGQATELMDQGQLAAGLDVIRAAIAEFDQAQCSPFGFALLVKAEAELLLKFDQPAAARDALELVDTSEDPIVGLATTRARIAMHEGNPSTACELLQHWLTNAKRRITSVHIDAFATHAVAALLCGRKIDASRSFQQAVAMADRTGCRRPLSLIPRPFVPLLTGESADTSTDCSLTPRERVVLGHIGRDATIREIASQLSVSQNTLKTQLRGLYRKLGARSRNEALSRARSLNLL